jgi:adenylosuccinate lyase
MTIGHTLSPLDGRYATNVAEVASSFSEFALMRSRIIVELTHVQALDKTGLFPKLSASNLTRIERLKVEFDDADYQQIKQIENTVRHDVKACELYLRQVLNLANPNQIHFGLTSEDVNNLAYSINIEGYRTRTQLPNWHRQLQQLVELARAWRAEPFPARTHGQHASPTTAGKEIVVYVTRLLRGYVALRKHRFRGKLNGATGNHSALCAAAPHIDWMDYEAKLVQSLGFELNSATTQIEDHASLIGYFDVLRTQNNICIDLCQDLWMYTSYGYLRQRSAPGEVGSSTMPHKINPIRFENAEGNCQLSSALLVFLSEKLSRSRMQRDLSESTVMRNIGVAVGHHQLGLSELERGLHTVALDESACAKELDTHIELLTEPVQTALRLVRTDDVYTELKQQSRGQTFGREDLVRSVATLPLELRTALSSLMPTSYLGNALQLVDRAIAAAEVELGK